jgi:hypothetical protein
LPDADLIPCLNRSPTTQQRYFGSGRGGIGNVHLPSSGAAVETRNTLREEAKYMREHAKDGVTVRGIPSHHFRSLWRPNDHFGYRLAVAAGALVTFPSPIHLEPPLPPLLRPVSPTPPMAHAEDFPWRG